MYVLKYLNAYTKESTQRGFSRNNPYFIQELQFSSCASRFDVKPISPFGAMAVKSTRVISDTMKDFTGMDGNAGTSLGNTRYVLQ